MTIEEEVVLLKEFVARLKASAEYSIRYYGPKSGQRVSRNPNLTMGSAQWLRREINDFEEWVATGAKVRYE